MPTMVKRRMSPRRWSMWLETSVRMFFYVFFFYFPYLLIFQRTPNHLHHITSKQYEKSLNDGSRHRQLRVEAEGNGEMSRGLRCGKIIISTRIAKVQCSLNCWCISSTTITWVFGHCMFTTVLLVCFLMLCPYHLILYSYYSHLLMPKAR